MKGKFKHIMPILTALVIVLILIFIQIRHRQEAYQHKQAEEKEPSVLKFPEDMPADQKAFYGTYMIREPEKKLEALEQFITDFPDSSQIASAKQEMFKATVKVSPDDREKILNAAERLVATVDGSGSQAPIKYYGCQFIAKELFAAGLFLGDAEEFAVKSLEVIDEERYVGDMKKLYPGWQKEIPPDAVLKEKYRKELAAYRTTLGRIYLATGRASEGEKILEEAYTVDPTIAQAAIGLAEISEKRGEISEALNYLTTATLTAGNAMEDARDRIETLYQKTHDGSLDGLETMLDAAYRRLFPNPIKVEPYAPTGARSGRVVLAEVFTGAG